MRFRLAMIALLSVLCTTTFANWVFNEQTDVMTDEDTSSAHIYNGYDEMIVVRCAQDGFEIFVGVGEYIGSRDRYPVTYRVDKRDAVDAGRWGVSTDGTVVFVPTTAKKRMLETLKSGTQIIFRVKDYNGTNHTASFSLRGSVAALNQLRCLPKD